MHIREIRDPLLIGALSLRSGPLNTIRGTLGGGISNGGACGLAKFKIDIPVGPYNPDWAIVKHEDGEDKIYMVRETKSTADPNLLRPTERAKIAAAEKHFEAIGIDYAKSSPKNWNV